MDTFQLATRDETVELALADPELAGLSRGDELVASSEVIDELSLHVCTDSDVAV